MPAEENASTEENVVTRDDRSIAAKVEKILSTDIDANDHYAIERKITEQQELIEMLQNELRATHPSKMMIKSSFYTGIPSYSVFVSLLNLLVGHLSHSISDQFLLVLMKLRLAILLMHTRIVSVIP